MSGEDCTTGNTTPKMKKDCGHHGDNGGNTFKRIGTVIVSSLSIVGVRSLITWAVLQPAVPEFILQDVTVCDFDVSSPNSLTSRIKVTLSSQNSNLKIGVYCDRLDVYLIYRNQKITLRTTISQNYQGHNQMDVWSPIVCGVNIPVDPCIAEALSQDQANGGVKVTIEVEARVRFKVGNFISGKYHLSVRCPVYIRFGNDSAGVAVTNNVLQSCSAHV